MSISSRIVVGCYSHDDIHDAERLRASLDALGERHDLVQVIPVVNRWQHYGERLPAQILAALERHPNDTLIVLGMTASVRGCLAPLARLHGDAALCIGPSPRARDEAVLSLRSGTIVIRGTEAGLRLVRNWVAIDRELPVETSVYATLPDAIACTPDLSIDVLGLEACAVASDGILNPTILHAPQPRRRPGWLPARWRRSS